MERITTSKKVEFALKDQGRNKSWLAKELGISRPILYQRLSDNIWQAAEVMKLKTLGLI